MNYENFSIAITTIMSLAKNAYQIFKSSRVETQRAILNILLSNLQIKDKQISYDLRKPFDLINSLNEKTPPKIEGVAIGDPNGIRTRVAALRGPRPRPLDDGTINLKHLIDKTKQFNMQAIFYIKLILSTRHTKRPHLYMRPYFTTRTLNLF